MISAVASVLATRSICSYRSSITGDEPYSSPYDFRPAMPSATRCFACAEAWPPAETVGESRSVDAINGESCANVVRCCGAQVYNEMVTCDPGGQYLTKVDLTTLTALAAIRVTAGEIHDERPVESAGREEVEAHEWQIDMARCLRLTAGV